MSSFTNAEHTLCSVVCGQVIHGTSTLDMRKVNSARARILDINPHIHVEVSTVSCRLLQLYYVAHTIHVSMFCASLMTAYNVKLPSAYYKCSSSAMSCEFSYTIVMSAH
jgi:hypothetical protein